MRSVASAEALPQPAGAVVERVERPTARFYRYLYRGVGEPWIWCERWDASDEQLLEWIAAPHIELYVLRHGGAPAGYVELDCHRPDETQIAYFGLFVEHIGHGLGRYLLDWSVRTAFARGISRLWVHTCNLDHARALATYQRAGFIEYQREEGMVEIPTAALERSAALGVHL